MFMQHVHFPYSRTQILSQVRTNYFSSGSFLWVLMCFLHYCQSCVFVWLPVRFPCCRFAYCVIPKWQRAGVILHSPCRNTKTTKAAHLGQTPSHSTKRLGQGRGQPWPKDCCFRPIFFLSLTLKSEFTVTVQIKVSILRIKFAFYLFILDPSEAM